MQDNQVNLKPEMENETLSNEKIKSNVTSANRINDVDNTSKTNKINSEKSINNRRKISKKERTKKLRLAFTKMSLMAMLLIVSTYAWFTSQKDITLSNLRGTVEVAENMEISLDAKTWYQEIDLTNANTVFTAAQTSKDAAVTGTAEAILPVQLLPVSGVGEIGSTLMPLYEGKAQGLKLTNIETCAETDADGIVDNGYFAFDIYIKNTSKDGADDTLQLNINSAVQVLAGSLNKTFTDTDGNNVTRTYTGDAASGLQNTVRVGLALYGKKEADGTLTGLTSSTATQEEILNTTKGVNITDIAIWEPNAKDHVEYIVENNNKLINETEDNKIEFTDNQEVETYALNEDAPDEGTIENIYDISSTGLGLQRTFKTEKTSTDDYKIKTTDNKPLNIKSIQTESDGTTQKDFKITSNTVSRLRVYVWLEGQDIDCINLASQGGGIELDLGLTKDDEVGDVNAAGGTGDTLVSQIYGNGDEHYGKYTNYPVDIDGVAGDNDWKIFYADASNVYLIADDYALNSKFTDTITELDMNTNGNYSVYWNDPSGYGYTIDANNKYMISQAGTFTSSNENYQAVGSLLDTTKWTYFADSNGNGNYTDDMAESAIGSPTIEMFVASWNEVYGEQLYCNNTNTNGYYVGTTTAPTSVYTHISSLAGYGNPLYFPHQSSVDEDNCKGYWLASLSANSSICLLNVGCDGRVNASWGYIYVVMGCRPVVCLKTSTIATLNGDIWELDGI